MWFYIWFASMLIVAPLLTHWRISTGKVTALDIFSIVVLTLASPFGIVAWMFEQGSKVIIWKAKNK